MTRKPKLVELYLLYVGTYLEWLMLFHGFLTVAALENRNFILVHTEKHPTSPRSTFWKHEERVRLKIQSLQMWALCSDHSARAEIESETEPATTITLANEQLVKVETQNGVVLFPNHCSGHAVTSSRPALRSRHWNGFL